LVNKFPVNPHAHDKPPGGYPAPAHPPARYADGTVTGGSDGRSKARDILSRQARLEEIRSQYEGVWRDVADYCAPDAPDIVRHGFAGTRTGDNQAARTDRRTRRVYDTTVRIGARRLAAGLESLITPQNEKWHGITTAALNDEETDEEKEWGESVRDFLFSLRYSAGTGFVPSMQQVYENIVRFGPAYLYAEEDFTGRYVRYCSLPVPEAWIARNRWGEVDTLHRKYRRSARVCLQLFGSKCPEKVRQYALDPLKQDEMFEIVMAIYPNKERQTYNIRGIQGYLDGPFTSCHVMVGEEAVVKEGTFSAFPVSCFSWSRSDGDDYGTSPVIELLTEVREINAVRKTTLRGLQQMVDPPIALTSDVDWLPPIDPGSRHAGLIDDLGRPKFLALNAGMRPDFAFQYIQDSRNTIQEGLYVNLFQVLVSKPSDQTATEALIRQEEKGALLGPAGSSIQAGLAMLMDRELSILEQQGIYEPGSRFYPPESLSERPIRPSFTSPLDVMRKAGEARAVVELFSHAGAMAQMDPGVLDNLDTDEALRVLAGAGRAPQKVLRRREEVEEVRKQKARAATAQTGMAGAQAAASVAKDAVPALAQAAEAGLLPGLGARAPQ
jgi:hypothetical protein